MKLLRFISVTALITASSFAFAQEDVTLVADFAQGSTQDLSSAGTEFTVQLTLDRDGGTEPLTGYDIRVDFDTTQFEAVSWMNEVSYLPAEYTYAVPDIGTGPANGGGDMGYFHLTSADLAGANTALQTVQDPRTILTMTLRTLEPASYPLAIQFMQNDRSNRDQGPELVFGAGATTLPGSVTYDHTAFAGTATPTPTPEPTATPEPTPEPTVTPTVTPAPVVDSDRDGLTDAEESVLGTNPNNKDTDGDGFEDGVEVALGTDPLDPNSPADNTDADGDGVPDAFDPDNTTTDADGDGYHDFWEIAMGTDPNDPLSKPSLGDADMNGSAGFTDAFLIFQYFLGNELAVPIAGEPDMDLNRDGRVDSVDGVLMFNWFLGNIPYLPFP